MSEEEIEKLKWENIYILEDNENYQKENEKLKAQIEKMKCCENCKHFVDNDCSLEHDYDCKRWNNHKTEDYWECVE